MYQKNLTSTLNQFRTFVILNRLATRSFLRRLRLTLLYLLCLSLIFLILSLTIYPDWYHPRWLGLNLILFALWLEQILVYTYSNSFYFRGLDSVIASHNKAQAGITFAVADTLIPDQGDLTRQFLESLWGRRIAWQAGLDLDKVDSWVNQPERRRLQTTEIPLPTKTFTLRSLAETILKQDTGFSDFIQSEGVTPATFLKTARWLVSGHQESLRRERWWSRDNLSRHGGLGRELVYGYSYALEEFSKPLRANATFANLVSAEKQFLPEIEKIEVALANSRASNVLLIGNEGVGKMDILLAVEQRLRSGRALNALSGQHLIPLDIEKLVLTYPNQIDLEAAFHDILDQVAEAGNLTIIIENFSDMMALTARYQVSLPIVIDDYLAMTGLHIIATDTPANFHRHISPLGGVVRRFEQILVEELSDEKVLALLEAAARNLSYQGVYFTYPALEAILAGSKRSLQQETLSDRALDFLAEISGVVRSQKTNLVQEDFVYTYISEKTGIPMGPIDDTERDQLLGLEDELHCQVIGQDAAINSIARALRRARLQMSQTERPIGSFLFLGPTGVGKTETAKSLSRVLFKDQNAMIRFDMSEYSQADGLAKLIGEKGATGALADKIRQQPYAVLLFDEFEKATQSVHDLFLQMLDEGFFTDGRGERVNLRTTIIIATSNAAADLIAHTTSARMDAPTLESAVVDNLIKNRIFRRELINRFDDVVVFEPLNADEYFQIAYLMVDKLKKSMADRGYKLRVSTEFIKTLIAASYDDRFGARALQRLIAEKIEDTATNKIIAGQVEKGGEIVLEVDDL